MGAYQSTLIPFMGPLQGSATAGHLAGYSMTVGGTDFHWASPNLYGPWPLGKPWGSGGYESGWIAVPCYIPAGATITEAYIKFIAGASGSGTTVNLTLAARDEDTSTAVPADRATQLAWARTAATVSWSPAAWTQDSAYNSPDISTLIQEIVDRAGWASGNGIAFLFTDNGSTASAGRNFWGANAGHKSPRLYVSWTHPTKWTGYANLANEGQSNGSTLTTGQVGWGRSSSVNTHPFMRFANCQIPKNATITSATLRLWSSQAQTPSGWEAYLYFNAEDDAVAPTTGAEFAALDKTTNYLTWTPPNPSAANTPYEASGAGLVAALQEIVSRAGYAAGNDIQIVGSSNMTINAQGWSALPFSSTVSDGNYMYEYAQPILEVEFDPPSAGGQRIMMVS